MLLFKGQGDIFSESSDAIVNPVNCVGAAGKGVAYAMKLNFRDNYNLYFLECQAKKVKVGKMFVTECEHRERYKYIINFPTKVHWKNPSQISYIEHGLNDLIRVIKEYNLKTVVSPALGCGMGDLPWQQVKSLIEYKFSAYKRLKGVYIIFYLPRLPKTVKRY